MKDSDLIRRSDAVELCDFYKGDDDAAVKIKYELLNSERAVPAVDAVEVAWISVKDRMPEEQQTVLAYCAEDDFCYISRMHQSFESYDVTHWIPLPKFPMGQRREDGDA